jgi:hypothetical protein
MTDATYTADAGSIAGFAQVMDALVVITSGDVSNAQTVRDQRLWHRIEGVI